MFILCHAPCISRKGLLGVVQLFDHLPEGLFEDTLCYSDNISKSVNFTRNHSWAFHCILNEGTVLSRNMNQPKS